MKIPVVISNNGYGLPVRQVTKNAPTMKVATNGFGLPIVLSDQGLPFIVQGLGPVVPVAPTVTTPVSVSDTTPTEGDVVTITPGTYAGTAPITVNRTREINGVESDYNLLVFPTEGGAGLTVIIRETATNSADSITSSVSFTVQAAADTGFTSPDATVVSATDNGDDTWTVVLSNSSDNGTPTPDRDRSYIITQQQLDEGKGIVLDPPVVAVDESGAQPVWSGPTRGALIIWPDDDVGVVTAQIWVSGVDTEASLPYTGQAGDEARQTDYVTLLTNNAGVTESFLELQAEEVLTYAAMPFRSADSTTVKWATPSGLTSTSQRVLFARFIGKPAGSDTDWDGSVMGIFGAYNDYNPVGIRNNSAAERKIGMTVASSPLLNRELTYAQGDVIDIIMAYGDADGKIMRRVNGGTWTTNVLLNGAASENFTNVSEVRLGGKPHSFGDTSGFDHDQFRSAIWLGSSFDPAENLDAFFKSDGSLEHPSVAVSALGTPLIDFYNGENHGSLGAGVITPSEAFS